MAHIGTRFNTERSGDRNDLALSKALRKVPDVRHLDTDLYQYDPQTKRFEIFFEATSQKTPKNTTMTRQLAKATGAWTALIVHEWQDEDHEHPVTVTLWQPDGKLYSEIASEVMSWKEFEDVCVQIHHWFKD